MHPASWTDWLERHFGSWAIPNVTRTFIILNALVYVLSLFLPSFAATLVLNKQLVLQGEYWRLFTFMIVPSDTGVLWFLLYLYFLWWVGNVLEMDWGSFRVNLYFILGMVSLWVVAYFDASIPYVSQTLFIGSLIIAFGTSFPDEQIFIFPLPIAIKAKYIAIFSGALSIFAGWGHWFLLIGSFMPYLLFFLPSFIEERRATADAKRRMDKFRGDGD